MGVYRVSELADAAGLSVDTVRYYQSLGLLQRPERRGRTVVYDAAHLATLRRIRELAADGLSLKVIKRLLGDGTGSVDAALRDAIDDASGARFFTRDELAAVTGVPEPLLVSAEAAGLLAPVTIDGVERYSDADADLVRAGLRLLETGLPLDQLLSIAVEHARSVEHTVDRAIALFNDHVRKSERMQTADDVIDVFTALLPAVTAIVALHFQRTLTARGRARLDEADDVDGGDAHAAALLDAIETAPRPHLEVVWR